MLPLAFFRAWHVFACSSVFFLLCASPACAHPQMRGPRLQPSSFIFARALCLPALTALSPKKAPLTGANGIIS
jgi:hypothetical protein